MKAPTFFTALSSFALAFAMLGTAEAQDSVHFKKQDPVVGSRRVSKEGLTMKNKMSIEANGQVIQTLNQDMKANKHFIFTVLAVKGKVVTKLKVAVKAMDEKLDQGEAGSNEKSNPMVGKTFILETIKDVISVTDGDGNPVEESLVKEARKAFAKELAEDKVEDFSNIIPDRPVKIGETLQVPAAVAKKLFESGGDDFKVEKFVIKLIAVKEIRGEKIGVFAMSMNMAVKPSASLNMSIKFKGTMSLGVNNSWPYDLSMSGPLVFSGKEQGMDLTGKGSMGMNNSNRYSGPRAVTKKRKAKLY
ncbi:MAG: hypothetical protein P1V97_36835 [Planctomycetota bacterium]|nr:hypothetical protein [Planctomycetota bacterium]